MNYRQITSLYNKIQAHADKANKASGRACDLMSFNAKYMKLTIEDMYNLAKLADVIYDLADIVACTELEAYGPAKLRRDLVKNHTELNQLLTEDLPNYVFEIFTDAEEEALFDLDREIALELNS